MRGLAAVGIRIAASEKNCHPYRPKPHPLPHSLLHSLIAAPPIICNCSPTHYLAIAAPPTILQLQPHPRSCNCSPTHDLAIAAPPTILQLQPHPRSCNCSPTHHLVIAILLAAQISNHTFLPAVVVHAPPILLSPSHPKATPTFTLVILIMPQQLSMYCLRSISTYSKISVRDLGV